MMLSTITGGVRPTSIVGGIRRSGTIRRNLNQAAVGANEPMPSVSKNATTAPSPIASRLGAMRSAIAAFVRTSEKARMARTSGTRSAFSMAALMDGDAGYPQWPSMRVSTRHLRPQPAGHGNSGYRRIARDLRHIMALADSEQR